MIRSMLAMLALVSLPALARSEKGKVVQKALRESVRVEVMVKGKVERAASGELVPLVRDCRRHLPSNGFDRPKSRLLPRRRPIHC